MIFTVPILGPGFSFIVPERQHRGGLIARLRPSPSDLPVFRDSTGRKPILSFAGGYHGMTLGTLSLIGNLGPKAALGSLMADVQILPYSYDYRCPFSIGGEAGMNAGLYLSSN